MVNPATGPAISPLTIRRPAGAAAVVAGHAVDALADQLGRPARRRRCRRSALGAADRAGGQVDVAGRDARRAAVPARGMAGRLAAELARPRRYPSASRSAGRPRPARAARWAAPSPSNGRERSPARAERVFERSVMRGIEQLLVLAGRAGSWPGARSPAPTSRRAGGRPGCRRRADRTPPASARWRACRGRAGRPRASPASWPISSGDGRSAAWRARARRSRAACPRPRPR